MTKEKTFEEKIKTLEEIVVELDKDDVTLEKSLELYQQGVQLAKDCGLILKNAEMKVEELHHLGEDESSDE
ncbi:exodeoxyribonuclease VII small subunit [Aliicoccus persicus]|uniref:Exodeoxyribonuclease 7 small subunit n=1 Tax=Aliicoccus persicus TaxID=930138 RepID=A0A662Z3E3_9STAP|nr:exodeoxyribonuclease VII small subunit [Aliicoccus persicus]SEV84270.1 Exodeoxyribonuclease VII small subunit [Aliicoccus persicus]HJE18749.1 exodeoxyribonuclease VII small subunit [Aliicoccus persicus]